MATAAKRRPNRVILPTADTITRGPKRPATRADCQGGGSCHLISCQWNLLADVSKSGTIQFHIPRTAPRQKWGRKNGIARVERKLSRAKFAMRLDGIAQAVANAVETLPFTCTLDVIDSMALEGTTLEQVGASIMLTREAVRLIEVAAIKELLSVPAHAAVLRDLWDHLVETKLGNE